MVKKEIKSIILYLDSAEAIEYLTNEQTGILMKAVFRYARTGQKLESSDTALIALFTIMCAQIDRDHKKYEERCERNVANAKKRYEKQHQNDQSSATACDGMQSQVVILPDAASRTVSWHWQHYVHSVPRTSCGHDLSVHT